MKRISADELKANLEEYLRAVQAGERVVVCEHERAVAELVQAEGRLVIRRGSQDKELLKAIAELPPLGIDIDVVAILRESRDQR